MSIKQLYINSPTVSFMSQTVKLRMEFSVGEEYRQEYLGRVTRKVFNELKTAKKFESVEWDTPDQMVTEGKSAGLDPVTGAVLVVLVPAAITALANIIQSWIGREANRAVTLKCGDKEIWFIRNFRDSP